ncbi:MAG: adenine deaminase [Anaerolineae bacterium]|jgi:adenine deaminase|nr:adenine deaminase [Anaerolineae bacterium]MBT7075742.1 adenine deaminase [Anaerolineae bacterium]MBT7991632.1 adenine deaminase [Anaerolineae bacterium]
MSSLKLTKKLVNVAMGRETADIVIRNGVWVSVQTGEFIPNTDIAIIDGHIAFVGKNASHTVSKDTIIIDAQGKYLVPGLLDGHMHIESGMVTVTEFVRAVAKRGTTGIFADPHEIANVFGIKGVKLMVDEAAEQPIHVWVQMPSCVPSAPGFETPGSEITPDDVAEAMQWDGIIGLGEVMDFPGVFNASDKMMAEIAAARDAGKVIGGHYPNLDLGRDFHGYVAAGIEDDHEGTRPEDAIARVRQGMKSMLRYGSAWHDVESQVDAILKHKLDSRRFILCTDDSHVETLVEDGHMDRVLRHALDVGLPPMIALQMMTINTAEHFGLSREIGMIAPGRWADVLIVDDLTDFSPKMVIAKGQVIAQNGEMTIELPKIEYPEWVRKSVHLGHKLEAQDFAILTESSSDASVTANVIGVIENQAPTKHLKIEVKPKDGQVHVDIEKDLAKLALVERHKGTGSVITGLVSGFGFTEQCGIASTFAHDSHHMIVTGTNEEYMALAANKLAEVGGGQVVIKDGEVIGLVELEIAGLMSREEASIVAKKAASVLAGFEACGCTLNSPNMQFSLLSLVVIPELRISDLGLVDVSKFEFVPIIE